MDASPVRAVGQVNDLPLSPATHLVLPASGSGAAGGKTKREPEPEPAAGEGSNEIAVAHYQKASTEYFEPRDTVVYISSSMLKAWESSEMQREARAKGDKIPIPIIPCEFLEYVEPLEFKGKKYARVNLKVIPGPWLKQDTNVNDWKGIDARQIQRIDHHVEDLIKEYVEDGDEDAFKEKFPTIFNREDSSSPARGFNYAFIADDMAMGGDPEFPGLPTPSRKLDAELLEFELLPAGAEYNNGHYSKLVGQVHEILYYLESYEKEMEKGKADDIGKLEYMINHLRELHDEAVDELIKCHKNAGMEVARQVEEWGLSEEQKNLERIIAEDYPGIERM